MGGGGGKKVLLFGSAKNLDEPFSYCQMEISISVFFVGFSLGVPKKQKQNRKLTNAIVLIHNGTVFLLFGFQMCPLAFLLAPIGTKSFKAAKTIMHVRGDHVYQKKRFHAEH